MDANVSRMLDLSWVLPDLALGGRVAAVAVPILGRRLRVRRVVDLRAEASDDEGLFSRHRIELLRLPTPDHQPISFYRLCAGVGWVNEGLDRGRRVVVHCEHGIGRSALLAACVLVSRGYLPCQAIRLLKRARRKVSPSPDQLHALLDWSRAWFASHRLDRPATTWDELAAIAYEHVAGGATS